MASHRRSEAELEEIKQRLLRARRQDPDLNYQQLGGRFGVNADRVAVWCIAAGLDGRWAKTQLARRSA